MPKRRLPALTPVASVLLAACQSVAPPSTEMPLSPARLGMANPASVFCVQQGGTLRMVRTVAGEHGICVLPDGREVEEWALFRLHHPSAQ